MYKQFLTCPDNVWHNIKKSLNLKSATYVLWAHNLWAPAVVPK